MIYPLYPHILILLPIALLPFFLFIVNKFFRKKEYLPSIVLLNDINPRAYNLYLPLIKSILKALFLFFLILATAELFVLPQNFPKEIQKFHQIYVFLDTTPSVFQSPENLTDTLNKLQGFLENLKALGKQIFLVLPENKFIRYTDIEDLSALMYENKYYGDFYGWLCKQIEQENSSSNLYVIVSDFQGRNEQWTIIKKPNIKIFHIKHNKNFNVYIENIELSSYLIRSPSNLDIYVNLISSSTSKTISLKVFVYLDKKWQQIYESPVYIESNYAKKKIEIPLNIQGISYIPLKIELEGDEVEFDNSYYFVLVNTGAIKTKISGEISERHKKLLGESLNILGFSDSYYDKLVKITVTKDIMFDVFTVEDSYKELVIPKAEEKYLDIITGPQRFTITFTNISGTVFCDEHINKNICAIIQNLNFPTPLIYENFLKQRNYRTIIRKGEHPLFVESDAKKYIYLTPLLGEITNPYFVLLLKYTLEYMLLWGIVKQVRINEPVENELMRGKGWENIDGRVYIGDGDIIIRNGWGKESKWEFAKFEEETKIPNYLNFSTMMFLLSLIFFLLDKIVI